MWVGEGGVEGGRSRLLDISGAEFKRSCGAGCGVLASSVGIFFLEDVFPLFWLWFFPHFPERFGRFVSWCSAL